MTAPILIADNIAAGYRNHPVLSNITLRLASGEFFGIVGPNGSGKSTLVKVLAGQHRPDSGRVLFESRDLSRQSSDWIAQRISRTLQVEAADWPATVHEHVLLGRAARRGWFLPFTQRDREVVAQCIADVGLSHLLDRRITELSAGEAQRAHIARALAQEPRVLLLDEPTSHLDLKYQHGILELSRRLAIERGLVIGIVLHDLGQAATWCDRVIILSGGQIAGDGPPRVVFTPELLARVYDIPVAIHTEPDGNVFICTKGPH